MKNFAFHKTFCSNQNSNPFYSFCLDFDFTCSGISSGVMTRVCDPVGVTSDKVAVGRASISHNNFQFIFLLFFNHSKFGIHQQFCNGLNRTHVQICLLSVMFCV